MIPFAVVDASVAVKWFLYEKNSDKAKALLERPCKWTAPDLLRVEIGSAITKSVRMERLNAAEGSKRCEELLTMLNRKTVFLMDSRGLKTSGLIQRNFSGYETFKAFFLQG